MRPYILASLLLGLIVFDCFGQSELERKIITEGKKLYQSEMASWYGTDMFMAKFQDKQSKARGYFSYSNNGRHTCVFFSGDKPQKILASFTFDSTYNINTAVVDGNEREMTSQEAELVSIRTAALAEYQVDRTLFKSYKKMNPNFIPVSDELGKRVYVLTGPAESGIVVFGNDYLLSFDSQNNLTEKKQLHANLIVVESKGRDENVLVTSMHSHVQATGPLITPTDICTLMLYCPFTQWKQHIVMSQNLVSIWTCGKGLALMPRDAWDKMKEGNKYLDINKN